MHCPSSRSGGSTSAARACAPGRDWRCRSRGTCSASRWSTDEWGGSRRPPRMTRPDRATGRSSGPAILPFVAAGLGLVLLFVAWYVFQGSDGFAYAFAAYDAAARRLLAGDAIYLPGTVESYRAGDYEGLFLYPPPVA